MSGTKDAVAALPRSVKPAVVEGTPQALRLHGGAGGAVAGDDGRDRTGVHPAVRVGREQVRVAAQVTVELEVRRGALGLDVDQELQRSAVTPVHGAAVGPHPGDERVEVERFEGAGRVEIDGVVGDEELVADEVDVGLDTPEAVGEGVEQGALVVVVVVGVGAPQRAPAVTLLVGSRVHGGQCDGAREGGAEGGEGSATGGVGHALPPWKSRTGYRRV